MINDPLKRLYAEATQGDVDAMIFLLAFHDYAHEIDDFADGEKPMNPEALGSLLMRANVLYSLPFFVNNSAVLSTVMSQICCTWLDSVAWEKDATHWKRQVADVLRLCGNDMVRAVANICGGFKGMRDLSLRLREFQWHDQHEPTYSEVAA